MKFKCLELDGTLVIIHLETASVRAFRDVAGWCIDPAKCEQFNLKLVKGA